MCSRHPRGSVRRKGLHGLVWRAVANPGFPTVSAAADHAMGILSDDRLRLDRARLGHKDVWPQASAAEDLAVLMKTASGPQPATIACLDETLAGYQQSGATRDMTRVRRGL